MAIADSRLTTETQTFNTGSLPRSPYRLPRLEPGRYVAVEDEADVLQLAPGADRYFAAGNEADVVVLPLAADVTTIGRSPAADIVLDDASVSRRHALLARRDERTLILDNRSLNGVRVNGKRVSEASLNDGDTIAVGRVVLRFVERR